MAALSSNYFCTIYYASNIFSPKKSGFVRSKYFFQKLAKTEVKSFRLTNIEKRSLLYFILTKSVVTIFKKLKEGSLIMCA